jgi:3-deoxy-manno-octulosonate cytidylyltransferase (CMP-KDO synthetase)
VNLGVIPGRLNSKRFPRKIIYPLNGKAIVEHVYDNAKKSKYLDKVIIAIDSEETKSHLSDSCNIMLTSSEHKSGTDRVAEVSEKINSDIVVNIQGDEPKIDPNIIDSLILLFNDPSVEIASVASTDLTSDDLINPNIVKVCLDDNNYALKFERDISLQDQQYFRHIGIYAYRSETLKKFTNLDQTETEKKFKLEQLRALDNNIAIKILITNFQHRSIDIENDLKHYEI